MCSYMNFSARIPLSATPEQQERLRALQQVFAQVCNELTPHVREARVWNRVALHHLFYRRLREAFPALGSQMVCNAIYAVSKISRLVYQHPKSPYSFGRSGDKALPLLRFSDAGPVYFDRHTLSVKDGKLSLFTMDGRIRFDLGMSPAQLWLLERARLREVVLQNDSKDGFELLLMGTCEEVSGLPTPHFARGDFLIEGAENESVVASASSDVVPDYVQVELMS